jgi:hypothetical protein
MAAERSASTTARRAGGRCATVFTFLGALLLSFLVAMVAAHQLAMEFRASEEFILVLLAIPAFVPIALAAFAIAYPFTSGVSTLNIVAIALAVIVIALVALPGMAEKLAVRATASHTARVENTYIVLELVIPALLAVLVQWGMVRRRWLRVRGAESLTQWPWITTIVAAVVALSPIGLAFVGSALNRSPTNWLRDLAAMIVLTGVLVAVVAGLIECYIRGRLLRRRLAATV